MKQAEWTVFDSSLEPVLVTDSKFSLVYANQAFSSLFDQSLRRLKAGRPLSEVFPDCWQLLDGATGSPSLWQDLVLKKSTGADCAVQVLSEPWVGEVGSSGWLFFIRDTSLEQRLQHKYKLELQQKEQFIEKLDRKLFEVSFLLEVSNGLNRDGETEQIIQWSLELMAERFGFPRGALVQITGPEIKVIAQIKNATSSKQAVPWEQLAQASPANWLRVATGNNQLQGQLEAKCILLFEKGETWSLENQDLLESAASQVIGKLERDLLYSSSITDEKTGLYNFRFLQATLSKEFVRATRSEQWFGLIMIDIDHFKKFNDRYGHQTGDDVLVHVARVIKRCLRGTDTAARFGGEEFCVVAVDTNAAGLSIVMERIRAEIEKTQVTTGEHGLLSVTVSLGGVIMNTEITTPAALLQAADTALYAAKSQGRNKWILA